MGKQIGRKHTWTIPNTLNTRLAIEVEKRAKIGQSIGTVERDIACIALLLSLGKIEKLSEREYNELVAQACGH